MKIGYSRISTADQNLDLQTDALTKEGCEKIFSDVASGAKDERKGLAQAMEHLRAGDVLVVWRLDRLGRSIRHLIDTVTDLNARKVGFESITESINTTTTGGKLVFHIFAALAEFERSLIQERTRHGLSSARARGRVGGRKKILDKKKIAMAQALYDSKEHSIDAICEAVGVSKPTLYRYIDRKAA